MNNLLNLVAAAVRKILPDDGWLTALVDVKLYDDGSAVFSSSWNDEDGTEHDLGFDGLDELEDVVIPLFQSLRKQLAEKQPWSSAVFTLRRDGSFDIEYKEQDADDEDTYDSPNADARLIAFGQVGEVSSDVLAPILGPIFTGAPIWPSRPAWRKIRRGDNLILVSDGLSDPWPADDENEAVGKDAADAGFGVEVFMETPEMDPDTPISELSGTWLFSAVSEVCNVVAGHGGIRELIASKEVLSIEIDGDLFPDSMRDEDGRVGVLLGVSAEGIAKTVELPIGDALLLAITLITPDELAYIGGAGDAARRSLRDLLVEQGIGHLSLLTRDSLAPTGG